MNEINRRIDLVKTLTRFVGSLDTFKNRNDIRSISIHALAQSSQNYFIALILSENLRNLNYCKSEISNEVEESDLLTISDNFDGYIRDAFFIASFLYTENHIRQIAIHFEKTIGDLNKISITATFKNLMNLEKTTFFSNLTNEDFKLFEFYCHLRNTIHNVGFQTQSDSIITINDSTSIFNKDKIEVKLSANALNNLNFDNLMLLQEQIFKLVIKLNISIPNDYFIEHKLSKTFN